MAASPSGRGRVEPFHVMEVLKAVAERRRGGADVLALCVGQPSAPAPGPVLRAAAAALRDNPVGYTEALGIRPLRERIASHYRDTYGVEASPEDVVVTTGSSGGFLLALLAAFDAGDEVAMARPGYPAYRNDLEALGCRVIDLECGADTRFQPTVRMLEALPNPPRGLVLASPSNPTGTIIDPDELAAIAAWCRAHDVWLISDEIYHGISFGRRCASAWEFAPEHSIVVGSVSKYWSMTGWRLGWLLVPEVLRRSVELLQGNLAICAPTLSQWASVAAFEPESLREAAGHVEGYARNRDLLLGRLPSLGITRLAPPDGAFYAYLDVGELTGDSQEWCRRLLHDTGVALAPGLDFDPVAGHRYARLSLCVSSGELTAALDRLEAWLG